MPEVSNEVQVLQPDSALSTEQIRHMIAQLSQTEDGEPLKNAMQDLKKALKANPVACAMLLPEDIGQMVQHLYKITGRSLEEQMTPEKKKGASKSAKIDFTDTKTLEELEKDLF